MPERGIDTGIWGNPKIQPLSPSLKLLYLYLSTNEASNPAGLYKISLKTISFDTGMPLKKLPNLLDSLKTADVEYFPAGQIVWVKKFFERQCKSPKFAIAALKGLNKQYPDFLEGWTEYNDSVLIQYGYSRDMIGILLCSVSYTNTNKGKGVVKGEGDFGEVFKVYEENIGLLTPHIGEQITDAIKEYSAEWVSDAIKVAAERNKRSWSYIEGILRSWFREGRDSKYSRSSGGVSTGGEKTIKDYLAEESK